MKKARSSLVIIGALALIAFALVAGVLSAAQKKAPVVVAARALEAGTKLSLADVEMVTQLLEGEEQGTLRRVLGQLLKPDLLIVDEVGYIPFGRPAANLFFQVVNGRYEQGSVILSSNRAFSGWGEIFGGDVVVAAAMIDRLVHHAEIISLKGSSYRLKGKETLAGQAGGHAATAEQ